MRTRLDNIRNWEELIADSDYNVATLAGKLGVPERHLRRVMTGRLGIPLRQWIDQLRIRRATKTIANGGAIKCAAAEVSFQNGSGLWKLFKRQGHGAPNESSSDPRAD